MIWLGVALVVMGIALCCCGSSDFRLGWNQYTQSHTRKYHGSADWGFRMAVVGAILLVIGLIQWNDDKAAKDRQRIAEQVAKEYGPCVEKYASVLREADGKTSVRDIEGLSRDLGRVIVIEESGMNGKPVASVVMRQLPQAMRPSTPEEVDTVIWISNQPETQHQVEVPNKHSSTKRMIVQESPQIVCEIAMINAASRTLVLKKTLRCPTGVRNIDRERNILPTEVHEQIAEFLMRGLGNDIEDQLAKLDDAAWQTAQIENTEVAYAAYLRKFPEGRHQNEVEKAQESAEAAAWQQAQRVKQENQYQRYLQTFPNGAHAGEARIVMEHYQDNAAWQKATQSNTHETYLAYINYHTKGRHVDEARAAIMRLNQEYQVWKTAERADTRAALTDYINRFPDGQYRAAAVSRLKDLPITIVSDVSGPIGFTADGQTIVVGTRKAIVSFPIIQSGAVANKSVKLQEMGTPEENAAKKSSAPTEDVMAISPDGTMLAIAIPEDICLWDAVTGKQLKVLVGHTKSIRRLAFSSDGRLLASAGEDVTVRVWDVISGKEIKKWVARTESLAIIRDPSIVAIGGRNRVELRDLSGGKVLGLLEREGRRFASIAFTADAKYMMAGDETGMLYVWNAQKQLLDKRIERYQTGVTCLAISPDGNTLASAAANGKINLNQLLSGENVRSLSNIGGTCRNLIFSPNGRILAASSSDNTTHIWDVSSR